MTLADSTTLPVLPLPRGTVLLPGVVQRIAVTSSRPDIVSLVAHVYDCASKAPNASIDRIPIACVPLASPLLGPNGQLLIQPDAEPEADRPEVNPAKIATKAELYGWGVAARISGVEGSGTGEFTLLVEGVARVRVDNISSEKAHLEGTITYFREDAAAFQDPALDALFDQLKSLSRELVAILRLSALLPRTMSPGGLSPLLARRLDYFIVKKKLRDAGLLADFMANVVDCSYEEKLQVLALLHVKERVAKVVELLDRRVATIKNNVKITVTTTTSSPPFAIMDPDALPQEIQKLWKPNGPNGGSAIPKGPMHGTGRPSPTGPPWGASADDDGDNELRELARRLDAANLSVEAAKVAVKEIRRIKNMHPHQAEYTVIRTYLETLAEIPWTVTANEHLGRETLARARKQLDDDHYGLEKVKKRLLEYLAVLRLKQSVNDELETQIKKVEQEVSSENLAKGDNALEAPSTSSATDEKTKANIAKVEALKSKRMVDKSPILLLAGPPGVGKTSLARSVATALGRKFHRISLGGVRDEAEIRGHRRTYVGAMPGLIVQGLKKAGVANPVFLLDEIDKLGGANFHGDPSAAMLEVLDPEQNNTFTDHYVNVPLDLSKVLFIATANSLDTIPRPLLDRLEMIYLPGYTTHEKRHIATQYLVPKQIRTNGLNVDQVQFTPEVIGKVIESYTREAGVRNLEREIGSVVRAKAVEYADAKDSGHLEKYSPKIAVDDLAEILGVDRFEEEIAEKTSRPGIVTGLVAFSSGGQGSILFIEVVDMPGSGSVQLTGKLGDVLKESVEVALTWVKAHAYELGLTESPMDNIMKSRSIHVHCPSGSIPKDGPSSGMAQAIALISLFSGKPVPPTMAMTGEISLRGRVTAVGGIKEKLIGALRAGVQTVLLPQQNQKDIKDLPQEVKDGLKIIHVSHVWEAIRLVWPDGQWPGEPAFAGMESRL